MRPYISIVIPIYNVEKYIEDCLSSIIQQDYEGKIECILVNDCSTDCSLEFVKNFINEYVGDINFIIINNVENKGQGFSRNLGIKKASGEYVLFVDSDDIISVDCLKRMTEVLTSYPDSDFVLSGMKEMNGSPTFIPTAYPDFINDRRKVMNLCLSPRCLPSGPCNRLIKLSFLLENNIFFPEGVIYEDVQFIFLLGLFCKSISFNKTFTYYYRTNREGSTITTIAKDQERGFNSRLIIMENCLNRLIPLYKKTQTKSLIQRLVIYMNLTPIDILQKKTKIRIIEKKLFREASLLQKLFLGVYYIIPYKYHKI